MMIDSNDIMERIKHLRNKLGLTQEEFAIRYGMLWQTFKKWEQGHRGLDTIGALWLEAVLIDPDATADLVARVNWRRRIRNDQTLTVPYQHESNAAR